MSRSKYYYKTEQRKVLRVEPAPSMSNNRGGVNILYLECGHTFRQQASVYVPKMKACPDCYEMRQVKFKRLPHWHCL